MADAAAPAVAAPAAPPTPAEKLLEAARTGNSKEVQKLLKAGADKDGVDTGANEYKSPLMLATLGGHYAVAVLLIDGGCKVDFGPKGSGKTALMEAADIGQFKLTKLLLKSNASVDATDEDGWSALTWAANGGHMDLAMLLREFGAKVDLAMKSESTPLHHATLKGHTEMQELLTTWGIKDGPPAAK